MKAYSCISASGFIAAAAAFPQSLSPTILGELAQLGQNALTALQAPANPSSSTFNAEAQLIDVSGIHEWQAPGPGDARGPCPGLNALANHGYLPRNGYATILQLTSAPNEVYNMGLDLSTILAAYGAALDGALISWSIGGQQHTGISGSHGNYETDSSPMRGDLNQYGSNVNLVVEQFQQLYNMQPDAATANYDIEVLGNFRSLRYNESVADNPYFFYAPFAGTIVSQAAFVFIYRFMANHSAANPEGILNQDVLKSFFAISGSDSSDLTWTPGYERIPENWYKRAVDSPYGVQGLTQDISDLSGTYPYISTPGCNTGGVNTFVPISQTNTSLSAYNFDDPTDGICYGIAVAINAATDVPVVGSVIEEVLLPLQNALDCPTVAGTNLSVGQDCPGYSLYGGPTGMIAPGAQPS